MGFLMVQTITACNVGNPGLIPGLEIPWRRKWKPTPLFLPGKSHVQRSLVAMVCGAAKELDMT